ncbi:MAG: TetR family transcriptional regulator [Sulfitobacter sp.]|nr:TetR family transcriptional regulator [Sulfitobacter sp.]
MSRPRLSPEKWIAAGFEALAALGPQALAAEPLARRLGTTKGSFYWHFKDVPTFQGALIDTWREEALAALAASVASGGNPDQRLRQLGRDILSDHTEIALRIWGRTDVRVGQSLKLIDEERLTYISLLLRELGLGNADFAIALQATLAGLPGLPASEAAGQLRIFDTLIDTVLALSE